MTPYDIMTVTGFVLGVLTFIETKLITRRIKDKGRFLPTNIEVY